MYLFKYLLNGLKMFKCPGQSVKRTFFRERTLTL